MRLTGVATASRRLLRNSPLLQAAALPGLGCRGGFSASQSELPDDCILQKPKCLRGMA